MKNTGQKADPERGVERTALVARDAVEEGSSDARQHDGCAFSQADRHAEHTARQAEGGCLRPCEPQQFGVFGCAEFGRHDRARDEMEEE